MVQTMLLIMVPAVVATPGPTVATVVETMEAVVEEMAEAVEDASDVWRESQKNETRGFCIRGEDANEVIG